MVDARRRVSYVLNVTELFYLTEPSNENRVAAWHWLSVTIQQISNLLLLIFYNFLSVYFIVKRYICNSSCWALNQFCVRRQSCYFFTCQAKFYNNTGLSSVVSRRYKLREARSAFASSVPRTRSAVQCRRNDSRRFLCKIWEACCLKFRFFKLCHYRWETATCKNCTDETLSRKRKWSTSYRLSKVQEMY